MVASGWVSGGGLVVVDGAGEWLWVEGRDGETRVATEPTVGSVSGGVHGFWEKW